LAIVFPVLRRLVVSDYAIFENDRSSGIDHTFGQGVHVIVGINGLGKTTLLNIIYRLLLGPKDMSKDDSGLASTQHKLASWRNRKYFTARVRDARSAWAEAEISFGTRRLTVRRSLTNLEVQSISLDGVPEEVSTQDRYEELVCELSGVASYFDFYAILRFIVFFLEDRPELIWDRRSQFDMFRLLFYDRQAARDAAAAYDDAQRLDSQFRNERVPIRRAKLELDAYDEAEQSGLASEVRAARRALGAAQDANIESLAAIEEVRARADDLRLEREKARLDLQEVQRAHEEEEQLYYQDMFPNLADTARHVFLNLTGAKSCLVCGSQTPKVAERLIEYAARHQCPICESMIEEQERLKVDREFDEDRLELAAAKVDEIRLQLSRLDRELFEVEAERRRLVEESEVWARDVARLQRQFNDLLRQAGSSINEEILLADDDEQIAFKRRYVQTGLDRLRSLEDARAREELRYMRIKESQASQLAGRLDTVKSAFARIARRLLAEQCLLRQEAEERRIGEEGERISFPILEVMMSSGVFTGNLSARDDSSSVSESQREFIDLAFRMALIEASADPQSDAMLVIETPEASLDSLFVTEAGELFRSFGAQGNAEGNVFIASTNLNNEGMIPALFGALPPPDAQRVADRDRDVLAEGVPLPERASAAAGIPPADRKDHLINLLDLSAPNAALRQHRDYYEKRLVAAVYADLPEEARPSVTGSEVPTERDDTDGDEDAE